MLALGFGFKKNSLVQGTFQKKKKTGNTCGENKTYPGKSAQILECNDVARL